MPFVWYLYSVILLAFMVSVFLAGILTETPYHSLPSLEEAVPSL